jgi:hypothetical protein
MDEPPGAAAWAAFAMTPSIRAPAPLSRVSGTLSAAGAIVVFCPST